MANLYASNERLRQDLREARVALAQRTEDLRLSASALTALQQAVEEELPALQQAVEQMTPYLRHRFDCPRRFGSYSQAHAEHNEDHDTDRMDACDDAICEAWAAVWALQGPEGEPACTCGLAALLVSGRSPGQE